MPHSIRLKDDRAAAIGLLRELRRVDEAAGVRHSGIARDVGLIMLERGEAGISVNQIAALTGYSGPTIRLVLERLDEVQALQLGERRGKTQFYSLTPAGTASFEAYVAAIIGFADRVRSEAARTPPEGRASDRPDPQGRYEAARPARAAAE